MEYYNDDGRGYFERDTTHPHNHYADEKHGSGGYFDSRVKLKDFEKYDCGHISEVREREKFKDMEKYGCRDIEVGQRDCTDVKYGHGNFYGGGRKHAAGNGYRHGGLDGHLGSGEGRVMFKVEEVVTDYLLKDFPKENVYKHNLNFM